MNKIRISSDSYTLDSYLGLITTDRKKIDLNISGDVKVFLHDVFDMKITILDNAKLEMYIYESNKTNNSDIEIIQNNNTKLILEHVYLSKTDIEEKINCNLVGNKNDTDIKIKVVQEKGKSKILEQINAYEGTCDNEAVESLRGLCCGGTIESLPNMEISTNNIICNHLVTIASYDQNELFYLMGKGLSKSEAKKLIKKGFLVNKYDLEKGES